MGRRFLRSVVASDLVALVVAMLVASWSVFGTALLWAADVPGGRSIWPFVALTFGSAIAASYIAVRSWAKSAPRPNYGRALAIVGFTTAVTAVGLVLTRVYWSRGYFFLTMSTWLALALGHRFVRRQRPWAEPMVVVTGEKQLADDLRDAPHADVVATLFPWERPPEEPIPDGATLVVDLRAVMSDEMAQFVSSSSIAGYRIRSLSEVYEEHTGRLPLVHLAEGWELTQPVERSGYAPVKRVIDIVTTVLTAVFWVPLGVLVWLWVRLDSRGPAIYRQRRIGRDDREFTLFKFRTMVPNAEADGPRFAKPDDPRMTRAGRFLRKSRLDEIPQLWNVIKGDLSIVGPRPERPVFVERFEQTIPYYGKRHVIRPGVTGWAQVNYGYANDEAETVEKLTYDLYYVKHSSIWLDLHVFGKSVWTVITGFGAR